MELTSEQASTVDTGRFVTYLSEADVTPTDAELVEDLPDYEMPPALKAFTEGKPLEKPLRRGVGYLRAEVEPETQASDDDSDFGAGLDADPEQSEGDAANHPDSAKPGAEMGQADTGQTASSEPENGTSGVMEGDASSAAPARKSRRRGRRRRGRGSGQGPNVTAGTVTETTDVGTAETAQTGALNQGAGGSEGGTEKQGAEGGGRRRRRNRRRRRGKKSSGGGEQQPPSAAGEP